MGSEMCIRDRIIPLSAEAGSEPEVTLVMEEGGIETRNTISLLVETLSQVKWTLIQVSDVYADSSSTMYFELQNTGNSIISDRIIVSGPNSCDLSLEFGVGLRSLEPMKLPIGKPIPTRAITATAI